METKTTQESQMVKVFEIDCFDIPLDDIPKRNEIFIALDPQKRLGDKTWSVLKSNGRNYPPAAIGLFWDKPYAIKCANNLAFPK